MSSYYDDGLYDDIDWNTVTPDTLSGDGSDSGVVVLDPFVVTGGGYGDGDGYFGGDDFNGDYGANTSDDFGNFDFSGDYGTSPAAQTALANVAAWNALAMQSGALGDYVRSLLARGANPAASPPPSRPPTLGGSSGGSSGAGSSGSSSSSQNNALAQAVKSITDLTKTLAQTLGLTKPATAAGANAPASASGLTPLGQVAILGGLAFAAYLYARRSSK